MLFSFDSDFEGCQVDSSRQLRGKYDFTRGKKIDMKSTSKRVGKYMKKYKLIKETLSDLVCGIGLVSTWRGRLTS